MKHTANHAGSGDRIPMRLPLAGVAIIVTIGCDRSRPSHDEFTELPLTSPATSYESVDPALAVDPGSGDVLLSWVGGDSTGWSLYFARSSDEGRTWSEPATVTSATGEIHPQGESSPRLVAATGGKVALVWVRRVPVPERRYPGANIRVARSLDGGRTWSQPMTLNDDTTGAAAGHQFHGAAWSGDSGLVVTWLDERQGATLLAHQGKESPTAGDVTDEPDAVIFSATSSDFAGTWSTSNQLLWGQVCPCCRVSLARGPDGRVVSAWRKHYPGNIRDAVIAPVGQGPAVEPTRVNRDNWVYPGCPYTGPGLSVDGSGATHVVWYMGKEGSAGVYYRRVLAQADSGVPVALLRARTLPSAHTTVAALSGNRALAAYDMTETGDRAIQVSLIGEDQVVRRQHRIANSAGGQYPQVVAAGSGHAVVAWIGKVGQRREIRLTAIRFTPSQDGATVALKE
jgi:hypothetical protein